MTDDLMNLETIAVIQSLISHPKQNSCGYLCLVSKSFPSQNQKNPGMNSFCIKHGSIELMHPA